MVDGEDSYSLSIKHYLINVLILSTINYSLLTINYSLTTIH